MKEISETKRKYKPKLVLSHYSDKELPDAYKNEFTGLRNSRYLNEIVPGTFSRFKKAKEPFTILTATIDDLFSICERFGKDRGNQTIRYVAQLISGNKRPKDEAICGRYGKSMSALFFVLIPNDYHGGMVLAERLRSGQEESIQSFDVYEGFQAEGFGTLTISVIQANYFSNLEQTIKCGIKMLVYPKVHRNESLVLQSNGRVASYDRYMKMQKQE
tara:strand:- start:1603 stop:2250 length:648 start_codon:yes stop_codon:yes gene_type:complete